jgi:hypothetical protein
MLIVFSCSEEIRDGNWQILYIFRKNFFQMNYNPVEAHLTAHQPTTDTFSHLLLAFTTTGRESSHRRGGRWVGQSR